MCLVYVGFSILFLGCGSGPAPQQTSSSEVQPAMIDVLPPWSMAAADEVSDSLIDAIVQSLEVFFRNLPDRHTIAVVTVASEDSEEGDFALEEITLLLVNAKRYTIVERRLIDHIREEQYFQLSGDVDDETAVSIGHLTGADLIITGSISAYQGMHYLRLKAMDVETGQIRVMTSQRF